MAVYRDPLISGYRVQPIEGYRSCAVRCTVLFSVLLAPTFHCALATSASASLTQPANRMVINFGDLLCDGDVDRCAKRRDYRSGKRSGNCLYELLTPDEEPDVIQPGKRTQRCALLAFAVIGISGSISSSAFAQNPPPPAQDPNAAPAPTVAPTDPAAPPPAAPLPEVTQQTQLPPPAPTGLGTPAPAAPPAVSYPTMAGRYLRLGDAFTIRPGIMIQLWAQASQEIL